MYKNIYVIAYRMYSIDYASLENHDWYRGHMHYYIPPKNIIFSLLPNIWVWDLTAQTQNSTQPDYLLGAFSTLSPICPLPPLKAQTWLESKPVLSPALLSCLSSFTFPSFKMSTLWQHSGMLDLSFAIINHQVPSPKFKRSSLAN